MDAMNYLSWGLYFLLDHQEFLKSCLHSFSEYKPVRAKRQHIQLFFATIQSEVLVSYFCFAGPNLGY